MLRGIYISATGLKAGIKQLDTIANNIANINTVGYRADEVVNSGFEEKVINYAGSAIGSLEYGVNPDLNYLDFSSGKFVSTGRNLDFALFGNGFFVVETRGGLRYTRAGDFQVNKNGYLCLPDGSLLLGEKGPIKIDAEELYVEKDGRIYNKERTRYFGRLRIAEPINPALLEKEGHNFFVTAANNLRPGNALVLQGFLEQSNVDPNREYPALLESLRYLQSNVRGLKVQDELLSKAVNELGKVR
ncbi:flagellar hook-basal body protein [Carboxydothermus pertinax]|uniref:Flagellar hook-basal body rod protein n=1 Tax=Carboxydothermus pertinax TaxID=870242 RepID=A0A1L8CUK7_9THEO|nr:flagellar hook-basal body protein [Carboxydothermus pertinax]GAV22581.1 flagellar hook-basal body rod protein [Carboxydothermus pertinax]